MGANHLVNTVKETESTFFYSPYNPYPQIVDGHLNMNLAIADMIRRNSSQEIVVEYDAGVGELGVLIRDSCIKYCPVVSQKHLANNIELNLSSHGLTTDYYQIKYKFQSSHKHLTSLIEENGPGCRITVVFTNYEAQMPLINRKMSFVFFFYYFFRFFELFYKIRL